MFSVVSFAEIGVKSAIGKLVVPEDLREHVVHSGLRILGLAPDHGLGVADLPLHHRDPFDRLLISQARSEGLTIMTADPRFADYDVRMIDAAA
jgi:PIN domain nuclease of toxin-antitoxin system